MERAAVGEPFTLVQSRTAESTEGSILEVFPDGDGFMLVIYLPNITEKEISQICLEKMNIRTIREGNFVLTMVQFGSSPLMFEVVFDPTLYADDRAFRLLQRTNLLSVYAVDPVTNMVKAIRLVSVPDKLMQQWARSWTDSGEPDFSAKYKRWVHDLENRYSTKKLWEYAMHVGKMGEAES